ncbi:MAG: ABC transporter permease [Phycisphaerales bacterium]
MNRRIFVTMLREYRTTAFTPAFFFAVVLFPAIIIGGIFLIGSLGLLSSTKSALEGSIGVADQTGDGIIVSALERQFDPEVQRAQRERTAAQVKETIESSVPGGMVPAGQAEMAVAMLAGREARIDLTALEPSSSLEQAKARLFSEGDDALLALVLVGARSLEVRGPAPDGAATSGDGAAEGGDAGEAEGENAGGGSSDEGAGVALEAAGDGAGGSAVDKDSVTIAEAADRLAPGTYEVYTSRGFDPQARRDIERTIDDAIVDERMRRAGLDPELVSRLRQRPASTTTTVTADAETKSIDEMQMFIPMAFMLLLWISVMTGGQYLLMSTIEEKSSRVMEVLLSAISPTELLTGKIIGQGLVALTVLAVYVGIGMVGLNQLGPQLFALLPLDILPWLVVYFVIAFGLFACLMAAVGSAVSDIREAQSLLGPIMILLMFPWFLWFFIVDNPNSIFATVLSYIPITTPFVMILRIAQTTDPVPLWQVITTSLVGAAGVVAVGWAAVKIFRIGVLMYGKPPSFRELFKWLRHG